MFVVTSSGILASMEKRLKAIPGIQYGLGVLALILLVGAAYLLFQATARPAYIVQQGQIQTVRTHANDVAGVLKAAGITVAEDDYVAPELQVALPENRTIHYESAREVYIQIGEEGRTIRTTSAFAQNILLEAGIKLASGMIVYADGVPFRADQEQGVQVSEYILVSTPVELSLQVAEDMLELTGYGATLGDLLWNAKLLRYESDMLEGSLTTQSSQDSLAVFSPSYEITIVDFGGVLRTRVTAATVGEALVQAGLALEGHDYAEPAEDQPVSGDGHIRVMRVSEEVILEQTPIAFDLTYQPVAENPIDILTVLQTGEYGLQANRVRVRYVNGEEIERRVEETWMAREPKPRIVGYGTHIEIKTLSTADGVIEYWRAIEMYATSYSPSRAGVPEDYQWFGITACGIQAEKGVVAIDRNYVPFFTPLYVPGYGHALACDTGSAINGRDIDLGYDDDNWESWHWNVMVYFLTPVPPAESIVWVFP